MIRSLLKTGGVMGLGLLAFVALGCPTHRGPDDERSVDEDEEQDFFEEECPECAPEGEPIPGELP